MDHGLAFSSLRVFHVNYCVSHSCCFLLISHHFMLICVVEVISFFQQSQPIEICLDLQ